MPTEEQHTTTFGPERRLLEQILATVTRIETKMAAVDDAIAAVVADVAAIQTQVSEVITLLQSGTVTPAALATLQSIDTNLKAVSSSLTAAGAPPPAPAPGP